MSQYERVLIDRDNTVIQSLECYDAARSKWEGEEPDPHRVFNDTVCTFLNLFPSQAILTQPEAMKHARQLRNKIARQPVRMNLLIAANALAAESKSRKASGLRTEIYIFTAGESFFTTFEWKHGIISCADAGITKSQAIERMSNGMPTLLIDDTKPSHLPSRWTHLGVDFIHQIPCVPFNDTYDFICKDRAVFSNVDKHIVHLDHKDMCSGCEGCNWPGTNF